MAFAVSWVLQGEITAEISISLLISKTMEEPFCQWAQ